MKHVHGGLNAKDQNWDVNLTSFQVIPPGKHNLRHLNASSFGSHHYHQLISSLVSAWPKNWGWGPPGTALLWRIKQATDYNKIFLWVTSDLLNLNFCVQSLFKLQSPIYLNLISGRPWGKGNCGKMFTLKTVHLLTVIVLSITFLKMHFAMYGMIQHPKYYKEMKVKFDHSVWYSTTFTFMKSGNISTTKAGWTWILKIIKGIIVSTEKHLFLHSMSF